MKRTASNMEVKKLNRNRVFRYLIGREQTSMPEIAAELGMSVPTVLTITNELKAAGVITEAGEMESTGGRKAKAIAAVYDARYAIGIDITRHHISLVSTDLSGKVLKHERLRRTFSNTAEYGQELADTAARFAASSQLLPERIQGVGIAVPGIVDGRNHCITYSHALDIYNVPERFFSGQMPWPAYFLNDANAAAITEIAGGRSEDNLVYLSLSNTVGGAVLVGARTGIVPPGVPKDRSSMNIYTGDHWRSGEFGHIVIHPEGRKCYCGKRGCLDEYCSALKLAQTGGGSLEGFFAGLESGDSRLQKIWNEYLEDLAIGVDNLRMCFDCDVILGGYVGNYMEPYLDHFRELAAARNIFDRDGSYVHACRYQREATALGAALYQIEKFIEEI